MTDEISAEELFHHYFHYFSLALKVLEMDAVAQCNAMNNFNVAWEIRDDLLRDAAGILNYSDGDLSAGQRTLMHKLVIDLEAIPTAAMSGGRTAEASQRDMNHTCWIPLREQASQIIKALESAAKRNREYFYPDESN